MAEPETVCRLCRSTQLTSFLELERSPQQLSRLLKEHELAEDRMIRLTAFRCSQCGFVQLADSHPAVSYEDYELSWMHIQTLLTYRQSVARDFVSRFALRQKSVLDVGCGSGEFLTCLRDAGAAPSGIEPSLGLVNQAKERGFDVIQGLVSKQAFQNARPFDAWTCLQVLEHLTDPVSFLTVLRGVLPAGGKGLVEVPRLEFILSERRFYDFFGDHVNYFSDATLRLTCELAGYKVLETQVGFDEQFLIAVITPAAELSFAAFDSSSRLIINELRSWVDTQLDSQKRIAVWGAGYKSIAAIAAADLPGIEYVIDSDQRKHGLYTPGSHLRICPPSSLITDPVDAIVLLAVAYKREILKQIREELGFEGPVVALGSSLESL